MANGSTTTNGILIADGGLTVSSATILAGAVTESGNNASSTAVRALIKQFVANENPKKPLSDNQLSDMLKEQGIDCARRTVAKYRESLRIAPTNLRKTL